LDLIYKLAARTVDLGAELSAYGAVSATYDRRAVAKFLKQLDEQRRAAVEQLRQTVYVHRQIAWLQDRFPTAELQAVPGLIKLVDRTDIVRRLRIFGQRDKLRLSGPKRGRDKWA
jgi:type I restriction enzyme M protein